MENLINLQDPVIKGFLFYSTLLIGKTLIMSLLTANTRRQKKIFISPEDTSLLKDSKVVYDDPDIERVRRAHLNDIENITMFLFSGIIYILAKPNPMIALNLFRSFTLLRFIHTFVYAVYVIPQPTRALAWGVAYAINWYMLYISAKTFFYP